MDAFHPRRCLDEATLAAFVDGGLDAPDREAAEAHLAGCDVCREAATALSAVVFDGADAPVAPVGLADRVLAALPLADARPGGRRSEGIMARVLRWSPMAAAVTMAVAGAAWMLGDDGPAPAGGKGADALPLARAAGPDEARPPSRPPDLGDANRDLAHLSTDKPVYRPGERVFGRAAVLNGFDRRPRTAPATALFEVRSGRGEVVARVASPVETGVAAFGWEVPAGAAGGRYTLVASFPDAGLATSSLEFDVRDFRAPRLSTDLQFARKAYGAGDTVTASLKVTRAEGGLPVGAKTTAVATVDGVEVHRQEVVIDALGTCAVSFALPKELRTGDATLAMTVADGGVVETAAKSIPVVVNRVVLAMYPEGGDLVAGVPCRVYVEARTPKQRPADVAGRVLDDRDRFVASLSTVHEGRGRFAFVPEEGRAYRLVLDQPAGITAPFALPPVAATGLALTARADAFGPDEPVRVALASRTGEVATVALYARERELALARVHVPAGRPVEVVLPPVTAAYGVLRVTAYDAMGTPRAERLVLRRAPEGLKVTMAPQAPDTVPGGRVKVDLRATDALGRPVEAVFGVAATDDSVLSTVDPRERAARLPVQAMLGAEVAELFDPAAYLGPDADAARNVDLLLATQGWRRFAYRDVLAFVSARGEPAGRVCAVDVRALGDLLDPNHVEIFFAEDLDELALVDHLEVADEHKLPFGPGKEVELAKVRREARKDAAEGRELAELPRGGRAIAPGVREPNDPPPPPPLAAKPPGGDPAAAGAPQGPAVGFVGGREEAKMKNPGGRFRERLARRAVGAAPPPAWVRVYAHAAPQGRPANARTDFTETVYWNAALRTDADGRATVEFDASDAVTTLRLRADAFALDRSLDGALASADATVEVRRPFYVEAKLPLEVTAGDRIDLPVALVNGRRTASTASLRLETGPGLAVVGDASRTTTLAALGSSRVVLPLEVGRAAANVTVRLSAVADVATDDVARPVRVVPAGFPVERAFGGVLERIVEHRVTVPADVVEGSLVTEAAVYPTPLASLTAALEALLREPCGCFEQTSSSNYPNVMALQYLKSHAGVAPELVARAQALLARGYQKLTSFECREKGYEWFGGDPGHEALTAYGLLEFADMAQVMTVDPEMLARTRAWLRSRRDGKGGFQRNGRALDTFGAAPEDVTNAYIVWALVEGSERDLGPELAAVKALADRTDDPYVLALVAATLRRLEDPAALPLLARLGKRQADDGRVAGAATSITRSGGESLDLETTSLAVLAWLRVPEFTKEVERGMAWIATRCKAGRFGSTQATVLALKAIVAYDATHAATRAAGTVVATVDGVEAARVPFAAAQEGAIVLPDLGARLTPGEHVVVFTMEGGSDLPYAFTVRYASRTPDSSPRTKVALDVRLAKDAATEGDPVDVAVTLRNTTAEGLPMVTAIVGLPGGLEARPDALKDLVKAGTVAAFETRGREVILYWRAMAPSATTAFTLPCVAAIPGRYTGPSSRAYLYYTDEDKVWVPGVAMTITAR
ncbi:MAG: MG2 domain-containing protein [Planctomycetota bacterium]